MKGVEDAAGVEVAASCRLTLPGWSDCGRAVAVTCLLIGGIGSSSCAMTDVAAVSPPLLIIVVVDGLRSLPLALPAPRLDSLCIELKAAGVLSAAVRKAEADADVDEEEERAGGGCAAAVGRGSGGAAGAVVDGSCSSRGKSSACVRPRRQLVAKDVCGSYRID